jgi:predicted alpha/beta-hydrolase family hydrolase
MRDMRPTSTAAQLFDIQTSKGEARWHIDVPAEGVRPSGTVILLGHGAGGGVEAADLARLATELPRAGHVVARFEQPWRLAGRRVAVPSPQLDAAWNEAVPKLLGKMDSVGLVVGGRSAGARVACRTAAGLAADGVLALAFPLHPPGRPDRTRTPELNVNCPLLVVQGELDPFGNPADVLQKIPSAQVVTVPGADHSLVRRAASPITQSETDEIIAGAVLSWLESVRRPRLRESSPSARALSHT